MYGATKETPLMPLAPERRREFASRRQNASKRSVAHQIAGAASKEKPVFKTLFAEPQSSKRKISHAETPAHPHVLPQTAAKKHRHSHLYTILNPHSKQWPAIFFKRFISIVILSDLVLFILSTDVKLSNRYEKLFHTSEGFASCVFLIEYIARLTTIMEKKKYAEMGPLTGRLRYASTWGALVDLFATLPFFLEHLTGWDLPTLTYLRFFRLFRILKTEGYVQALDAVYRVIYFNREILWVAVLLCMFLVLVTAVLLYYLRPQNAEDSSQDFQSIAATLYLSTLMLTGQGPPDGDLPWYTKLVVLITSVFSVAMFAIPASMLTWGFEAEAARMAKATRQRSLKQLQRESGELPSSDCSTSSFDSDYDDGYSTDEEYLKIIAGAEDDGGETSETETPFMKQLREAFLSADGDADGSLTLQEFLRMQAAIPATAGTAEGGLTQLVESNRTSDRMVALEAKVEANNQKLDRILELLQQGGAKK
jgi:voltage-gated potassium channel